MSVHIPSKPSPPNAPLYPIPFTGIFPVDTSFQIVKTASGVQNESPSLLYSSDCFTVIMCGYSWTHLMHPTHLCFSGLNPPKRPPKTPERHGLLRTTSLFSLNSQASFPSIVAQRTVRALT